MSESEQLARNAAESMIAKKAQNVVLLDVSKQTDITDYFVICSAESDTQMRAIADNVLNDLSEIGEKPFKTEGWNGGQWIILDFFNFVAHVFYHESRDFYKLEKLWSDAVSEEIKDEVKPTKSATKATKTTKAETKKTEPAKSATEAETKTTKATKVKIISTEVEDKPIKKRVSKKIPISE